MKKILNIGIPVALQDGFIQVSFIVITVIANRRGLDTARGCGDRGEDHQLFVFGSFFYVFRRFLLFVHRILGRGSMSVLRGRFVMGF